MVSGRSAGLEALAEAQALLHRNQLDACLVIAVEVAAPLLGTAPVAPSEELGDAAVALLLCRADSPLAVAPAAFGYLLSTAAAYRAAEPAPAFAWAAEAAMRHAALPASAVDAVLGEAALPRDLSLLARVDAAQPPAPLLPERQGAAAAVHALMIVAAGSARSALILSGDSAGQVAAAVWSRVLR